MAYRSDAGEEHYYYFKVKGKGLKGRTENQTGILITESPDPFKIGKFIKETALREWDLSDKIPHESNIFTSHEVPNTSAPVKEERTVWKIPDDERAYIEALGLVKERSKNSSVNQLAIINSKMGIYGWKGDILVDVLRKEGFDELILVDDSVSDIKPVSMTEVVKNARREHSAKSGEKQGGWE